MLKKVLLVSLIVLVITATLPQPALAKEDECYSDGCLVDVRELAGHYITVIKATTHGDANMGTSWIEVQISVNGTTRRVGVRSLLFKRWLVDYKGFSYSANVPTFPVPRGVDSPKGRLKTDIAYAGWLEFEDPEQVFEVNKSGWVNAWYADIRHLAVFEAKHTPTTADNTVARIYQKVREEPLEYSYWYSDPAIELLWWHVNAVDYPGRRTLTNADRDTLASLLQLPENNFLYWYLYKGLFSVNINGTDVLFTDSPVACERISVPGDFKRVGVSEGGWLDKKVVFFDLYNIDGKIAVDGIKNTHRAVGFLLFVPKSEYARRAPPTPDQIRWFCP